MNQFVLVLYDYYDLLQEKSESGVKNYFAIEGTFNRDEYHTLSEIFTPLKIHFDDISCDENDNFEFDINVINENYSLSEFKDLLNKFLELNKNLIHVDLAIEENFDLKLIEDQELLERIVSTRDISFSKTELILFFHLI
jgi:hypothetical protein